MYEGRSDALSVSSVHVVLTKHLLHHIRTNYIQIYRVTLYAKIGKFLLFNIKISSYQFHFEFLTFNNNNNSNNNNNTDNNNNKK